MLLVTSLPQCLPTWYGAHVSASIRLWLEHLELLLGCPEVASERYDALLIKPSKA